MKNLLLTCVLFIFGIFSFQGIAQSSQLDTTIIFSSEILGENRSVHIGLPKDYFQSSTSYASTYVLDAEYKYDICRSMHQYFEISTRMPGTIMIGIANVSRETRNRDLLPSNFGGSDSLFRSFLQNEMIPYIEENFRVNDERALFGHSHGGVFAVNTLLQDHELFKRYIAVDASFQIINSALPDSLSTDLSEKSLYISSSDGLYGFGEEVSSDMITNNMIFQNFMVQNRRASLNFFAEHIQDDHGHSLLTGFHRGYRWVMDWPISKETLRK